MYRGKYEAQRPSAPKKSRPAREKTRSGPRIGTIVFYSIYVLVIIAFFIAMNPVLDALNQWLVSYEASQPKVKCQEVFDSLFSDPDWAELYTLAGVEDTVYEGKEAYAAYMEGLVGQDKLTFSETSAGLSGDKKYIVSHKDVKIATFTLTAEEYEATEVPDWKLGTVEIFFSRNEDLTIRTIPGYTVTVNGVALDDSHIIRTVSTAAESYLPAGLHGYRLMELQLGGLLIQPDVQITDHNGNPVEVTYDAGTNVYTHAFPVMKISEEEYNTVLTAIQVYCRFMIRDVWEGTFKKYFDPETELYTSIVELDTWMQDYSSFSFTPETISDYYRYSDDLYSARVELTLQVPRSNGTVKDYDVATTLFLRRNAEGVWLVSNMTNLDIQEQRTLVRLTFKQGDEILSSALTAADAKHLVPPAVTVPEGKVFSGWFTETVDENGNKTMDLKFAPGADGSVSLTGDVPLEPMTLYALFANKTEA